MKLWDEIKTILEINIAHISWQDTLLYIFIK